MSIPLSDCCKRKAVVCGPSPDFIGDQALLNVGTCFYVCAKCGEPCNIAGPDDKAFDVPPRDKMIRRAKVNKEVNGRG